MQLQTILDETVAIAQQAGAILREGLDQTKAIERKSTTVDLVTEYDERVEKLIAERIRSLWPDHGIIAEESGASQVEADKPCWYVDPLDGTVNFAHGFPVFSVSLALYQQQRGFIGVVHDPCRGETFTALAGQGAWVQASDGSRRPLQVSGTSEVIDALVATGFPYDRHEHAERYLRPFKRFVETAGGVRRCGSAALDLSYVAAGRFDGFWEYNLHQWDVAAGMLILAEAGGRSTDFAGAPIDLTRSRIDIISSHGVLQEAMVKMMSESL